MTDQQQNKDLSRKPLPFLIAWGLPIALLISVNYTQRYLPAAPIILMIAGAYAWMGIACVINAKRCGRLHCFISGPVMLIGAALILLVGFKVVELGPVKVMHISYATLFLVFLSFVLEWIKGAYVKRSSD